MSDEQNKEVSLSCFVNFTDYETLRQSCAELEESLEQLSCAIENRRTFKRLKVEQQQKD